MAIRLLGELALWGGGFFSSYLFHDYEIKWPFSAVTIQCDMLLCHEHKIQRAN